jgi:hypothetical protein
MTTPNLTAPEREPGACPMTHDLDAAITRAATADPEQTWAQRWEEVTG